MVRCVLVVLLLLHTALSAGAAALAPRDLASTEAALRWIGAYRAKPHPDSVPLLIRHLSGAGVFKDPDSVGVYVGFFAGVLGANPAKARALIERTLPLPFEDQWLVIRAVAYSGLPNWAEHMHWLAGRLPDRRPLTDRYLAGTLPTLDKIVPAAKRAGTMERLGRYFSGEPEEPAPTITFEANPDLIDTLWGIYFASGREAPIAKIVALVRWAKNDESIEKLTVGNLAKYTLATNASRDVKLLAMLKAAVPAQPEKVQPVLRDVIDAAETVDTRRLRKEALAAIEELRRKGPGSKRELSWWGQAGELAISAGCLAAAATGQVQLGIPCVVGGGISSAALRYLTRPD